MTTQQTPPHQPHQPPASPRPTERKKFIKIVQHSQLFYWWPLWLVGFILGLITLFSGERLAVVSEHTRLKFVTAKEIDELGKLASDSSLKAFKEDVLDKAVPPPDPKDTKKQRDGAYLLVSPEKNNAPETSPFLYNAEVKEKKGDPPFTLRMAENKNLGVIWAITLVLIIVITNVPLRGMWSVVVLVSVVLLTIIFILAGLIQYILTGLEFLDIHINAGGYFFISFVLLIMWALTVFLFDQQTYWIFSAGQLRIHQAIGGGEKAYDTRGMVTEKHRDDLFRHWILGLGTGDLTVRTAGAEPITFRIQNVWWVGHKLHQIQEMQREMMTVTQSEGKS